MKEKLYTQLRRLREFERGELDGLSASDRAVLVEVGAAEEEGSPLNFKALMLLMRNELPPTSLRRQLKRLIDGSYLVARSDNRDLRITRYYVTAATTELFRKYQAGLQSICG